MGSISFKKINQNGFTIVELLIVVVVIAILASITTVAYSGIQERAKYTTIVSTVDAWTKAIEMAKVQNGDYPASFTQNNAPPYIVGHTKLNTMYACLAPQGTLPAEGNFPADACGVMSTDGGATFTNVASLPDDDLSQQLASYMTNIPKPPSASVTRLGSGTQADPIQEYRGILYLSNGTSTNQQAVILYFYQGDYDCPRGVRDSVSLNGVTTSVCSVTLK